MDSDSNGPHAEGLCVHVLDSTPEDMIVVVTPRSWAVYRISPLRYVAHGNVHIEEGVDARQVVISGTGEALTEATQREVLDVWYSHYVEEGQHPYAFHSRSLDSDGNVVREVIRSALHRDDDEGVN